MLETLAGQIAKKDLKCNIITTTCLVNNFMKRQGRPKGSQNKSTATCRAAIAKFAEVNVTRFSELWEHVASESPKDACDIYLRAIEYHIPKLARVDSKVTGDVTYRVINQEDRLILESMGAVIVDEPTDSHSVQ